MKQDFLWRFFISSKNKFYGLCHAQSTVEELNLDTPYCADCNLLFLFLSYTLQLLLYIIHDICQLKIVLFLELSEFNHFGVVLIYCTNSMFTVHVC